MSEGSLVSICMRSIGAVPKERAKLPLDDLDPLKHLIADRRSEKDNTVPTQVPTPFRGTGVTVICVSQ